MDGALTLLEAAKSGKDQHAEGVIETIIMESPMIEMLPWQTLAGNALRKEYEDTLPNVQFRKVNEGYTPTHGTTTEYFWGVAILGGETKVDNYLVDVIGTEESLEAKQWMMLSKANAMRFDYECFNGNGLNKGFKGLPTLIDEGFGMKLANSTTGAQIDLDKLDEANDLFENQGGADAILTNRTVRRQITKKARTSVSGVSLIDVGTDVFGRQVTQWNDIPIRTLGRGMDSAGNTVVTLPFTEDPGDGGTDCTSLYFAKFGESDITGLLGKGGSFSVKSFGEMESAPQRLGRLEWYPGIAIFNKFSVVRLTGITAV